MRQVVAFQGGGLTSTGGGLTSKIFWQLNRILENQKLALSRKGSCYLF
jgi:hypothetical protein